MNAEEAARFCAGWLPAWTGGDAARLAAFYSDDVFYADPARPDGVEGRAALERYLERLLGRFPGWVWTHDRSLPLPDGFVNFWTCDPGTGAAPFRGVCLVHIRAGLIFRNEVFFDPAPLRENPAEGAEVTSADRGDGP